MKKIFTSFLRIIKTSDVYVVTYLPTVLGMSLIFLGAYIGSKMYDDGLPLKYTSILFAISMLISSISGIAQIIRKESPWTFRFSFQGPLPVIAGFLWVIFCWVIAGYSIYSAIFLK